MSNKLKNIYTNAFDNIIKKHIRAKANTIFVLALRTYMWRISKTA